MKFVGGKFLWKILVSKYFWKLFDGQLLGEISVENIWWNPLLFKIHPRPLC